MQQSVTVPNSQNLQRSADHGAGPDAQIDLTRPDPRVELVPIGRLLAADSPRLNGIDQNHARVLAQVQGPLPPVVVHHATMRIIDGAHRVYAAELNDRTEIEVQFFYGSEEEAFQLAVRANTAHGLSLTLAERQAAAERIIRVSPHLSDRSIGMTAGLATKTVSAVRARVGGSEAPLRIGRDGRVRPVSTAEGRWIASRTIVARPEASLREIAREAGISVGTVRDVRARMAAGQDPVPARQRPGPAAPERAGQAQPMATARALAAARPMVTERVDAEAVLETLRRDPSMRYVETGRRVLRWLSQHMVTSSEVHDTLPMIPPHSAIVMEKIARECARVWVSFADELNRRGRECA